MGSWLRGGSMGNSPRSAERANPTPSARYAASRLYRTPGAVGAPPLVASEERNSPLQKQHRSMPESVSSTSSLRLDYRRKKGGVQGGFATRRAPWRWGG